MKARSRAIIQQRMLALAVLGGAILFFAYDIVADWLYEEEYGTFHFVVEFIVFVGISVVMILGIRDLRRLRVRLNRVERRNKFLSTALGESIDEQLEEWRVTRSEKEVAWLVIKGFRFAEIARIRSVKESTARLQATSLYAKAGVSGRAEFVAEILQPLLLSIQSDTPTREERTDSKLEVC
ncbi:MAG: hypothetical protein OXD40_00295 [bacterium]|nr:hypothetical protein [bacterium]